MVFRAYRQNDPSTEKKIGSSELMVEGQIQVVQASDSFCTGLIVESASPVIENSTVILMTDISDLNRSSKHEHRGSEFDAMGTVASKDPLDKLDQLDVAPGLGKLDRKKLNQLEKWQGNPDGSSSDPKKEMTPVTTPADGNSEKTAFVAPTPAPSPAPLSTPPTVGTTSALGTNASAIPPPSPSPTLDTSGPTEPPMVPMNPGSVPMPPSADATPPANASGASTNSEPALPIPPPPEL
jgi:hypothetical protein